MSDTSRSIDDDRLLAYALGLGPDPEIEQALAHDDALARRLARLREEVAAVRRGVEATVPPPAPDYGDLSRPQWARLRAALEAPAASTPPPQERRPHRWRRLVPLAAAAALAAVLGLAGLQALRGGPPAPTAVDYERGQAATAAPDEAATAVPASGHPEAVALVTAGPVRHGLQRLTVVRVFDGRLPGVVWLGRARTRLPGDRLALLFVGGEGAGRDALVAGAGQAAASPSPGTTLRAGLRLARPEELAGRPVLVLVLPPGTPADSVTLP